MNRVIAGGFWILLYLLIVLSPLVILMIAPTPAGRSFWTELSLGLGFVGLVQISVQFALIARFRSLTAPYGIDLILKYHRSIAIVAILLLIAHPLILIVEQPAFSNLLNPFGGTAASRVGNAALYALVVLALLSLFRKQIGLGYETWRVTHGLFGIAAILLSHVHVYLAGSYTDALWKEVVLIALSIVMVSFFGYLRLVKPMRLGRRPYRIGEARKERADTWSVVVEADGHEGMRFRPGQFAWLKVGGSPFTIEEHPFSFSSSAQERGRLEFGIKELGDFTRSIGDLAPGTRAFLDGPHGAFSIDLDPAPGYVFLAGGVGITPFMSMLRTMADRGDRRPVMLFYGSKSWEEVAYREAIARLESRLDLTVVHVLEDAPEDWQGETGFIDADLLGRHLPEEGIERLHFICGPEPMMEAVESALDARGIPLQSIRSERFDLV